MAGLQRWVSLCSLAGGVNVRAATVVAAMVKMVERVLAAKAAVVMGREQGRARWRRWAVRG